MKYVIAVIQPDRLDAVMSLLEEKEIHLVTVTSVMGRGRSSLRRPATASGCRSPK